jgi:DNA helicase-2/ATP-dependent DNA helicase PcrA
MTNSIRLSHLQQSIVEHGDGPLLVVAGPGSGKTRVLTERVRFLLSLPERHFKVLALTFSNLAANEMADRLSDLGDLRDRTTISTFHSFCLELLSDRGRHIGITGPLQIFEQYEDRKRVLINAVQSEPDLALILENAGDRRSQDQLLGDWLREISRVKSHPLSGRRAIGDDLARMIDSYNATLAASGAYDFDDLLLLAYRLLSEVPKVAELYQRIYRYVCVDEAQDLNEAQYAVLKALCCGQFQNVIMVGDPKQSIYGFNTSDPKYMERFALDFAAKKVELSENFRSSQMVVSAAQCLMPSYIVTGHLPIKGEVSIIAASDEESEGILVAKEINRLLDRGHADLTSPVSAGCIAVLGRNRYTTAEIEKALSNLDIPFYRRVATGEEYESEVVQNFMLGLRLVANPLDAYHFNQLVEVWGIDPNAPLDTNADIVSRLTTLAKHSSSQNCISIADALAEMAGDSPRLMNAVEILKNCADQNDESSRALIYSDLALLKNEWDQYLRRRNGTISVSGFMSAMALGSTKVANETGVTVMTIHASKGLEFDVVFLAGMVEGVLPDYRAKSPSSIKEEERSAFVAITRSRRLLYLSYPMVRTMPWGGVRTSYPSRFLEPISAIAKRVN